MRPGSLFLFPAVCLIAAPVFAAPPGEEGGKLHFSLKDSVVRLGDAKLTFPIAQDDLVKALGKPDRTAKLANTILTWDKLGIYAYLNPKLGKIKALSFSFVGKGRFKFSPKNAFKGEITVDGAKINGESTINNINNAKKGNKFANVFKQTPDWWKSSTDKMQVYLNTKDGKVTNLSFEIPLAAIGGK